MIRILIVLAAVLVATLAEAQQPPNCPYGYVVVAADTTVWACRGPSTAPVQVTTGGGGGSAWGGITGTLSNQTDLQTALDGKLATNGNGSGLTSLNASNLASGAVAVARGGTGVAALGGANQVLRTNGAANGTEWATIAGGSVPSYTLHVQALTSSPADGATIYFGQLPKAPVTGQGTSRIYIRKAGTITIANIFSFSGTAGTNENWTCNIRLNNTGDTAIATVGSATSERVWSNSGLSLAVTTSDYIEIKCVNPTWVTNPLTTIFGGYLVIEY